jgi:Protein of unknown function (DUF3515)
VAFAIAALTGTGGSSGNNATGALPAITVHDPPHATAEARPCTKVLDQLPLELGTLQSRVVHSATPFVVAWGDPPVVWSCGVDRPKDLRRTSTAEYITAGPAAGPFYDVTSNGDANVWTTVDRGPYIAITVPKQYQGSDVVPPISRAIAKVLPPVCSTDSAAPENKRCTRRP